MVQLAQESRLWTMPSNPVARVWMESFHLLVFPATLCGIKVSEPSCTAPLATSVYLHPNGSDGPWKG
jgi:hypothetical protein